MSEEKNKKTKKKTIHTDTHDSGFANDEEVKKRLIGLERKSEEEEVSHFARELNYPYLDINIFPIDQENFDIVSEKDSKKYDIGVIYKKDRDVKAITTNPEKKENKDYIKKLEKEKGYSIEVFVVSKTSMERLRELYKKRKLVDVFDYLRMNLTGKDLEEFERELADIADLGQRINELPVTEVIHIIFAGGMKLEASDIHFEPQRNETVRLRYRIDGVLQTITEFPINIYSTILSRVKILSQMMLNVHDTAQDGRFTIKLEKNEVDVRVSILPGNHGENIVVRLLGQDMEKLDLEQLGLNGLNKERLIAESEKKQGMIINSGPTGSGKTTTLYSIINRVNSPDKKIISIEDPIEYQVSGVSQTQVKEERGYTFENGLRSIVRQDPDIILVGEIRDDETADIAIHASLTGHLVLTSIHSSSSSGVPGRMIDLGVKPPLIASAVNAFVAQRLVRRLCVHCKEKYVPAEETVDTIKKILSLISPRSKVDIPKKIDYLWRSKGCVKCQGLGYKKRVAIFEVLTINEEIQELIEKMATEEEIRRQALEDGMITYEQDGMLKSIKGETSLEELQRVVGKGEHLMEMYEKIVIQTLSRGLSIETSVFEKVEKTVGDYDALKRVLEEVSLREMIKYILSSALLTKAGDIHIEPGEKDFKIRYRIDGILHDIVRLPMNEYLNTINEVKNLSGFKIQEREGVIDGRFRIIIPDEVEEVSDKKVDVRVSIILGGYGDIVVMRLLNNSAQATELKKLKLQPINLIRLKEHINKPNGIVMNTGPTGSGKTTTLYSALRFLNKPELKIITVEDPIEYQMDGVIQTQIREEEGYTFSTAMKSLLRQNPDIMMIGEIRDEDTAKIAYQAALTGHLVLTTLHTNNASGSVQRLVDMGVHISDIVSATNCFIAQRLVRQFCPHCKKEKKPSEHDLKEITEELTSISDKTGVEKPKIGKLYEAVGCSKCHNLGYLGRIPIMEVLAVEGEMEKFLINRPTANEIHAKALELGMLSMSQDGILRVLAGETSLSEVARVVREIQAGEDVGEVQESEEGERSNKKTALKSSK